MSKSRSVGVYLDFSQEEIRLIQDALQQWVEGCEMKASMQYQDAVKLIQIFGFADTMRNSHIIEEADEYLQEEDL